MTRPSTLRDLWRRGQEGWPRRYVLVQLPNAPLAVALAASVARRLLDDRAAAVAEAIAIVGLTAWAYLELADGANAFRRLLGAAFLVALTIRVADALS